MSVHTCPCMPTHTYTTWQDFDDTQILYIYVLLCYSLSFILRGLAVLCTVSMLVCMVPLCVRVCACVCVRSCMHMHMCISNNLYGQDFVLYKFIIL